MTLVFARQDLNVKVPVARLSGGSTWCSRCSGKAAPAALNCISEGCCSVFCELCPSRVSTSVNPQWFRGVGVPMNDTRRVH